MIGIFSSRPPEKRVTIDRFVKRGKYRRRTYHGHRIEIIPWKSRIFAKFSLFAIPRESSIVEDERDINFLNIGTVTRLRAFERFIGNIKSEKLT